MAASRERMLPNGQFINEAGSVYRQMQIPGGAFFNELLNEPKLANQAQTPGGAYAVYTK